MIETFQLGPLQTKWIEELESGKYPQGTGCLFSERGYCCLGVVCEILGYSKQKIEDVNRGSYYYKYENQGHVLPESAVEKIGLRTSEGLSIDRTQTLAYLNDRGDTFKQIAKTLRDKAELYFKESK